MCSRCVSVDHGVDLGFGDDEAELADAVVGIDGIDMHIALVAAVERGGLAGFAVQSIIAGVPKYGAIVARR